MYISLSFEFSSSALFPSFFLLRDDKSILNVYIFIVYVQQNAFIFVAWLQVPIIS